MNTISVELMNGKALQLLRDLEAMHIIRLHESAGQSKIKLSEKYRGILSKEDGVSIKEHTNQMRSEWNNI